jgi:thiol-disulfide isomerase/thioredoxin
VSRIFLIFCAALVALMAGALFYAARIPTEIALEQAAPQPKTLEAVTHPVFSLPDLEGAEREFVEWDGKHRLLNFWATWCAPCRREIPMLKAFQDEHGEAGFQILGIAVDYPEQVIPFAEETEFNYPILIGQQDAMAVAESSGIEFIGMPFTMVVSRDGELLGAYLGELHQGHLDDIVNILTRLDEGDINKTEASGALDLL